MATMFARFCCPLVAFAALSGTCLAQTGFPMLMSLKPVAVQIGQTSEVTFNARYSMHNAYQVLVSGDGVKGEVILPEAKGDKKDNKTDEKPKLEKVVVRFDVDAEAQPGVRDVRIATPQGVSTVGQLVVVKDPVVAEASNNNTTDTAQQVTLPAAICGAIEKSEDVDFYKFHVEAKTQMVFHCRCARLEDRIHDLQQHADPIMTLRTGAGVTLASSDNHFFGDPVLSYRFDQEGDYLLEVRDVRYQGNQYWEYCIEASNRPLVECVYPLAVSPGGTESLELVGQLLPAGTTVPFSLPTAAFSDSQGYAWAVPVFNGQPTNPVPVVVSSLPFVRESESPNDSPETAQTISLPAGVNGRIDRDADVDYFAFEAKKGEKFSFEVISRRRQSALDSHLRILDAKAKQLALNDDLKVGKRGFADSWVENWAAPADGKYFVEVRDVHLRGGTQFPYFLAITKSEPYFELYADTDKTQISPGGSAAIFVRVERKNGFTGEVQLAIDGLPDGINASCGRILAGKAQDGCIVLSAEDGATLRVSNVSITGTATHETPDGEPIKLSSLAVPYQETYQPGGGRGHWAVDSHAVAVTDHADIRAVKLSTYDITLKPGESKQIEVTIDRSPGFAANVTLDMLMRHLNSTFANTLPPGVTLDDKKAKSLLSGSATEGHLTLTAAKDAAPVEGQQSVVVAHVALNFVMKWTYASKPVKITVAAPTP